MTTDQLPTSIAMVALTAGVYLGVRKLYLRSRQQPLLHPVFASAVVLIVLLSLSRRGFESYRPAKEAMTWFLGPATVALAVPVYNQRRRLRSLLLPLLGGVAAGSAATTAAVLAVAALGHLNPLILHSLAFKSVTAAIAVELARLNGADLSLTVAFVLSTGMIGGMVGPALLTRFGILDPAARGIALGTLSHAIGTAAALGENETAGATAGLAMVLTALMASLYLPLVLRMLTF